MKLCFECSADIQGYLDRELRGKRLERLIAHLKRCARCQARFNEEKALADVLRQHRPLYAASDALRARISERIANQHVSNLPRKSSLRNIVSFAAASTHRN